MRFGLVAFVVALLLSTVLSTMASAQSWPVEDQGVYARGGLGLGITTLSTDQASATGFAIPLELVAGYRIIRTTALHLSAVLIPQIAGGGETDGGVDVDGVTGFSWFLGLGGTHYFLPMDLYLGASIGFGEGNGEAEVGAFEVSLDSDIGFGFNATVGKHWAVSPNVGAGVSFLFQFLTLPPDVGDGDNTTALLFGLFGNVAYR